MLAPQRFTSRDKTIGLITVLVMLSSLLLTGCNRDRMADVVNGPATHWMEQMRGGVPYPSHIRFHRNPSIGQWARYQEGETVIVWTVKDVVSEAQAGEQAWLVEQLILFVADGEWIEVSLFVNADGKVLQAEAGCSKPAKRGTPFCFGRAGGATDCTGIAAAL